MNNLRESRPAFYDFFAGAGLVELALQDRWSCVFANDIDRRKAAVHALNLDHTPYFTGDVADIVAADLPQPVEMAWASFPCQDLSLAGWRRGMSAQRSGTFWNFWRLMRDLHDAGTMPPIVVLENVVGLLHGHDFPALCESLAALNMRFGAMVINADRFVPQSRPRVFVVAVNDELDVQHLASDSPGTSVWFPKRVHVAYDQLSAELKQRWIWWNLPVPAHDIPRVSSLIEEHPSGVEWDAPEHTERLLSMMSRANLEKIENAKRESGPRIGFLYRRTRDGQQRAEVRFDGVAGCLRTPYGGSSRQTVVVVDGESVRSRLLSPREAARLMGVGDDYQLPPGYNDAYRAMGDAVAVPAVEWLSDHLLISLVDCINSIKSIQPPVAIEHNGHRAVTEGLASEWHHNARLSLFRR